MKQRFVSDSILIVLTSLSDVVPTCFGCYSQVIRGRIPLPFIGENRQPFPVTSNNDRFTRRLIITCTRLHVRRIGETFEFLLFLFLFFLFEIITCYVVKQSICWDTAENSTWQLGCATYPVLPCNFG
jgi:hypothetical protein